MRKNVNEKKNFMSFCELREKKYQSENDKLSAFMKASGLEFSSEKTNMILFNYGSGPKELPQFKLDGQDLLHNLR